MKYPGSTSLAFTLALATVAAPGRADLTPVAPGAESAQAVQRAASLLQAKKIVPVREALARVPRYADARLLQVAFREKSEDAGGRAAYEVYLLANDGLIWEVVVEAASGEVVQQHPEGTPAALP